MWVPIDPLPDYFCGCPPCPICFRWCEPATEFKPPSIIHGIDKFALDLVGVTTGNMDSAEYAQIKQLADQVHVRNLARKDAFAEADEEQRMARWLAHQRKQAKPVVAVTKLKVTLDQIELPATPAQPEKAPEPASVPVEKAPMYGEAWNEPVTVFRSEITGRQYTSRRAMEFDDQMERDKQRVLAEMMSQRREWEYNYETDAYYRKYDSGIYKRGR